MKLKFNEWTRGFWITWVIATVVQIAWLLLTKNNWLKLIPAFFIVINTVQCFYYINKWSNKH